MIEPPLWHDDFYFQLNWQKQIKSAMSG